MKKILLTTILIGSLLTPALAVEAKTKAKVSSYGPTALCRDGTYSYSATHRGTCSHHKGVRTWYK